MTAAEANQAFVRDLYRRKQPMHALATELIVTLALFRAVNPAAPTRVTRRTPQTT